MALCFCTVPFLVYFFLLRTVLVVAPEEARLYRSDLKVAVSVYPERVEGAILTPLAAVHALSDGIDLSTAAAWGLDEGEAEHFKVLFTTDDEAMWQSVYASYPAAAVLYDSTSAAERGLAENIPSTMTSFSYEGSLNSITVETMRENLAAFDTIIVYSPEKVLLLLRDEGLTTVCQEIYRNAFELDESVVCVGVDIDEMAKLMEEGSGVIPAPYRMD